jgi:hypothetical protein
MRTLVARFGKKYEFVSDQLQASDRRFKVGRIDSTTNPALGNLFVVEYIPVFYLYRNKRLYQLRQSLSPTFIIDYCKEEYAHDNPLSLMHSPLCPVGQIKSLLLQAGLSIIQCVDALAQVLGISPSLSIVLIVTLGALMLLVITALAAVLAAYYLKLG